MTDELKEYFRRRRFLFVLGQYEGLGGAERQALILATELKQNCGCDVAFLAWSHGSRVEAELKTLDIPAYTFPLEPQEGKLRRFLTLCRLARYIKQEIQPDYLLPYVGFNCKIVGMIWKQTGAKYTWWNQRDEGREIHGSRAERFVIQRVPDIVSNSFEGRDFLVGRFGLQKDQIAVINNGVRIPVSTNPTIWRERLALSESHRLISMVANLTDYKDHITLLRAFALVLKSHPDTHLALAGRPVATENMLKALAFDLGLCSKLHFVGELSDPTDLVAASDLVVHSSIKEGCPNGVLEAMALERCVCGTNISGIRQALGENAADRLLARPEDPESLATIISRLLADDRERATCGMLNKQRIIEHFSPQQLALSVLSRIRDSIRE